MKTLSWTLLLASLLPAQEIVLKSPQPSYELALPASYEHTTPREEPLRYRRASGREDWAKISLTLVAGSQPLKQNPAGISAEEILPFVSLPPDAKRTFSTTKWKEHDIGVIEYRAVVKDLPVIGLAAVLPLAGKALNLTLYAPDPLEKELREDFAMLLSRISKTTTNWRSAEELRKIKTLETVGQAGMGLLALYPVAWILFFRSSPMKAHWLRTGWLAVIAVLLFAPITSPGDTTLLNNLLVNAILPLGALSFAARRIKLGLDVD